MPSAKLVTSYLLATLLLLPFPAPAEICGDVDGNGRTSVTDGVQVLRMAAELDPPCTDRTCDLDGNGTITVTDGVRTLQRAAQLPGAASCGTRFGGIVKAITANGVLGELNLGTPPAATQGAGIDVVDISGQTQIDSGKTTTLTVQLQRAVDTLIVGFREGGNVVDGFVELPTGAATTVALAVDAAQVSSDATAELNVGTRVGEQVGGSRSTTIKIVAGGAGPGTIGCDQVIQDQIEANLDTDRFAFNIGDGQHIEVDLEVASPTDGFDPQWRLLDGNGQAVCTYCAGICGYQYRGVGLSGCEPLPASGNPYRLEVIDAGNNATGSYRLHLQNLDLANSCEPARIPADAVVQGTIDQTLDTDLLGFSFTPQDGEIVSINVVGTPPVAASFQPTWRLVDATGANACTYCAGICGYAFRTGAADCPLAAANGPYRIEVVDSGSDSTGSYDIFVQH